MNLADLTKIRVGKNYLHIALADFHEWRCPQCASNDTFIVISTIKPLITDARTGIEPFVKIDILRLLRHIYEGRVSAYVLKEFRSNKGDNATFKEVAQFVAGKCLETLEPDDIKEIVWAFAWCSCGAMVKLRGSEV